VALFGGWLGGDVRDKIELAEENVEEASPVIVVGIGELKDDEDMGFDVYSLEHGDRGSEDTGTSSAGVGHAIEGRLGGRVAVGVKKWVVIHDEPNARGSSGDQRRLRRANAAEAGASDASSASTAGVASG
jgi:hypothetical protein